MNTGAKKKLTSEYLVEYFAYNYVFNLIISNRPV